MQPFEKSYRLLSPLATIALPLVLVGMDLFGFVLLGCFEPVMDLECDRVAGTCTLEEHTWISRTGPTVLELETTRFELERQGKQTLLRIRAIDDRSAFDTGLTNASARAVKRKVDAFVADPNARTLSLHEDFPAWIILCFLPFVAGIALLATWGLGGQLRVRAGPDHVSVTRVRWRWRKEIALGFPAGEAPNVEATRFTHYKGRNQGVLSAHATTGSVELARAVPWKVVERVRDDLVEYFGRQR
jgi:hypothetical protein